MNLMTVTSLDDFFQIADELIDGAMIDPQDLSMLAYMAPEHLRRLNMPLDHRSDLYSVGVMFYKLLTGSLPFKESEPEALLHEKLTVQPVAPHHLNSNIPKALSDIILKLLSQKPEDRYQSAQGLKQDLLHCNASNFSLGEFDHNSEFKIPEKLYGREEELKQLKEILNKIDPIGVEVLIVNGYSGIGKTTIIHALEEELSARGGYFASGKFGQQKQNIAYSGLGDLFGHLIRQVLSEGDISISQWREKLLSVLGSNGQVIIDIVPELKLLIGNQPPLIQVGSIESKNRFDYTFQKFISVFSNSKRPLALFLDDLQWADLASLDALRLVLENKVERSLLLLGAFRDNEVDSIHPLSILLEEIKQKQINVHNMRLNPLKIKDIERWIGDAVRYYDDNVVEMSRWVYEKTAGNPFYIKLFLRILHEENLIYLNAKNNQWSFNIPAIKSLPATQNVGDLMSRRLNGLSQDLQYILQVAACFGNKFEEDLLGYVLGGVEGNLRDKLGFLVSQGLILKNEKNYRFVHDQVQSASLNLSSESNVQMIHIRIGKTLLDVLSEHEQEESIALIADHFNRGKIFLKEKEDLIKLININLRAATKAKGSMAYQAAFDYLDKSKDIVEENSLYFWENHAQLTADFFYVYSDLLFLLRKNELAEYYCNLVFSNSNQILDKSKISLLRIKHYALNGKLNEAIKQGILALNNLGVDIPENPKMIYIYFSVIKVKFLMNKILKEKDISHLISKNPLNEIIMDMFIDMIPAAHDSGNYKLATLFATKGSEYCLKNGLCYNSSYLLLIYSAIFCFIFKKPKLGCQFVEFSLNLNKCYENKFLEGRLNFLFSVFVGPWAVPNKRSFQVLNLAVKQTFESGDFFYYSSTIGFEIIFKINKSNASYHDIKTFDEKIRKEWGTKYVPHLDKDMRSIVIYFADYLKLCNKVIFNKKHISIKNPMTLMFYDLTKMMNHNHFEQYEKSYVHMCKSKNIIKNSIGNPVIIFYYFYGFLTSAVLFKTLPLRGKYRYLKEMLTSYKELGFWNKTCPENFSYYVCIMQAEFANIAGFYKFATKQYDQAIAISKQDQFLLDEALANELAAKFHLENDQEKIASSYMQEARRLYQRWGADAKIVFLEKRYPQLLPQEEPIVKENPNLNLSDLIEEMLSNQNVISLENESLFESNQKAQQRIQQHQTEIAHYARVNTLSELATGLAHEINQPLASSLNYLGGCLERLKAAQTSEEIIAGVEKASTGIERAGEIIQHLRASIKKQDITKKMININEVINHVLPLLNYKIKSTHTQLTLNLSSTLPNVWVDALQIEQVLINLINNALEALQEVNINKRKLIITTQHNQTHIEISIKDTGFGLDPTIQEKLFQPFATTKAEGLGMGLAICKTIVESYAGEIKAEKLEDATLFSVILPL